MADPKLPDLIKVVRSRDGFSMQIDGVEFPWWLADAGVSLTVDPGSTPRVTLTIVASRVEVVDSLDS